MSQSIDERMRLQSAEFDAVLALSNAYRSLPPVVDDFYPEARHRYDGCIRTLIDALRANGALPKDHTPDAAKQQIAELQRQATIDKMVIELAYIPLRNLAESRDRQVRLREKAEAKAARYDWLIAQTGSFQDGSDQTVILSGDDATRSRTIRIGGSRTLGTDDSTFESIIDDELRFAKR